MNFANKKDSRVVKAHKGLIKSFQKKFKVSDYQVIWLSFAKGLIIGLIIL